MERIDENKMWEPDMEEDEDEEFYEDYEDECGFDPYEGCYTYDC